MRLDARSGQCGQHLVWDVRKCREVKNVVWVDDESAQWGEYTGAITNFELNITTHQEDRITIYRERRLVLFNEIDDQGGLSETGNTKLAEPA